MSTYRQDLQKLLYKLFQFDSADLDFGFYAVMNRKREEIAQFIETDLLDAVEEGLSILAAETQQDAQETYKEARSEVIRLLGDDALEGDALQAAYHNSKPGKKFLQAKQNLEHAAISAELEAQIFNDLYQFFSRYYEDGDFISQRRYGRSNKYAIPYNGEEVHLHWANFDQYYVKTGTYFNNYSFTVPGAIGLESGASVKVTIVKVDIERDNVKGDRRFFVYASDQPLEWDDESHTLTIPFEYRPLTKEESKRVGNRNQQDKLLEEAHEAILKDLPNSTLRGLLSKPDPHQRSDQDRLKYHLSRYTAENTRDFFVHKDLAGFLQRELDYYLKNEVLRLDDVDLDDLTTLRRAGARSKTIRTIADKIITFLDQLESFQRRLFLKRKFVLQSDYCLTLDKIPTSVRPGLYPEILSNEAQRDEWKSLYHIDITSDADLNLNPHLMLDTALFDEDFKHRLIESFENVDEVVDGLLIHSDNFQALAFLQSRYQEAIKCIYIDPPYNTSDEGFIYKNNYKNSSWFSMMENRIRLGKNLLPSTGVINVAIDDTETSGLRFLLDQLFGPENFISTIAIEVNPAGQNIRPNVPAKSHDYCHIYAVDIDRSNMLLRSLTKEERAQFTEQDEEGYYLWDNLRRRGGNSRPTDRPNQWFPLCFNPENKRVSVSAFEGSQEVWPIDPKGQRRIWRVSPEGAEKNIRAGNISVLEKAGRYEIVKKSRMPSGRKPKTLWYKSAYSATTYGTKLLNDILGHQIFSYPKSLHLVEDCISYWVEPDDLILDFFAGSGTTGHAVINLNREDGGKRRYILVEMGEYFDSVLKPRIQKVAYSQDWKNGKPIRPKGGQKELISSGQSHMFQYIRLESYDDTFHNIRFRETQAPLLDLTDYHLSYFLEHETAGSPTLLDIEQFERPFEYKLNVTGPGGVLAPRPVDLMTTFNFLLGLTIHTIRHFQRNEETYVRVVGTNQEGQRVCVIWRNVPSLEEMDAENKWVEETVLADLEYDKLYINGESVIPGALSTEEEFQRRMFEGVH